MNPLIHLVIRVLFLCSFMHKSSSKTRSVIVIFHPIITYTNVIIKHRTQQTDKHKLTKGQYNIE